MLLFPLTCVSSHGFLKWIIFLSHIALALFLSVIYLCLLYGMYVPDWEYEVPTEPSAEPMKFSVSVCLLHFLTYLEV